MAVNFSPDEPESLSDIDLLYSGERHTEDTRLAGDASFLSLWPCICQHLLRLVTNGTVQQNPRHDVWLLGSHIYQLKNHSLYLAIQTSQYGLMNSSLLIP